MIIPRLFRLLVCLPIVLACFAAPGGAAEFRGRIAYSCDGNHNDPDDWAASPVALAIFAEMGLRERVVHFDYNCILPQTNPGYEEKHRAGVLGAAERYGYDPARLHDCRRNLDAALASLTRAVNDSTADNPLWLVIAGPMEFPFRALQAADPVKLRFVWCVSHSRWNDGFSPKYTFTHTKRSVIGLGVNWVQIRDQNRLLSLSKYGQPAKPEEFAGFFWMRDSADARARFLWERMLVSTRPDPSDAGMAWFVATGDEDCDPEKLRRLLDAKQRPERIAARGTIRLEAENFRTLDGASIDPEVDRSASHRLHLILTGDHGRVSTTYREPYAPEQGRFHIELRGRATPQATARLALFVSGTARGEPWEIRQGNGAWQGHVLRDVELRAGDEVAVEIHGVGAKLDYVELKLADGTATGAGKIRADYFPPPESEGGWRSLVRVNEPATAAQQADIRAKAGLDWQKLAGAQRYCAGFEGNNSFLVIRRGWIAGEWNNMPAPRGIASCTKSLTALAMAKLFDLSDAGALPGKVSIGDAAWKFLPAFWAEAEPARKQIQLRHLLTMTSGLTPYDGPYPTNTYYRTIFEQTVEAPPGTVWAYASVPVDMLGLAIEHVTGRSEDEFFHEHIGSRIGGARMEWGRYDGHTGGSGGPQGGGKFTARELARVGWLVLNDGAWERDGRREQVISAARVREFTRQAAFLEQATWRTNNFAREPLGNLNYGHLWWNNRGGRTLGPAVPEDAVYMSGWGKQACVVLPGLDMVVVRIGGNRALNDQPAYHRELLERVLAAVVE